MVLIDIETTGLRASKDKILAVAAAVLDVKGNILDPGIIDYLVDVHEEHWSDFEPTLPLIGQMVDFPETATPIEQVDNELCQFIDLVANGNPMWVGNAIWFDRPFVRAQLPKFEKRMGEIELDLRGLAEWFAWRGIDCRPLDQSYDPKTDVTDMARNLQEMLRGLR